jgi:hypothetical protein
MTKNLAPVAYSSKPPVIEVKLYTFRVSIYNSLLVRL